MNVEPGKPTGAADRENQSDPPSDLGILRLFEVAFRNSAGATQCERQHGRERSREPTMSASESNCLPKSLLVYVARATNPSKNESNMIARANGFASNPVRDAA